MLCITQQTMAGLDGNIIHFTCVRMSQDYYSFRLILYRGSCEPPPGDGWLFNCVYVDRLYLFALNNHTIYQPKAVSRTRVARFFSARIFILCCSFVFLAALFLNKIFSAPPGKCIVIAGIKTNEC